MYACVCVYIYLSYNYIFLQYCTTSTEQTSEINKTVTNIKKN